MRRLSRFLLILCGFPVLLCGCGGGTTPAQTTGTDASSSTVQTTPEVPEEHDIYVSPAGDDSADGTAEHPVRTVSQAIALLTQGHTIFLEDGTYYEQVMLPSGTEKDPVTLSAVHEGMATLTTAVPYTDNWQEVEPHIYRADLSSIADKIERDHFQVFCDGDALTEARYPNTGPSVRDILTAARAVAGAGTDAGHIVLSETPDFPVESLVGARVVVWPGEDGMSAWDCDSSVISAADGNVLTLAEPIVGADGNPDGGPYVPSKGNRFFLVGARILLDAPGEYYFDAAENAVYCRFPDDASPASHTVAFRADSTVISCDGGEYICIRGLRVFGGGVSMRDASHCTLSGCTILYGDHASYLTENPYFAETATTVTGNFNRVENCEIAYTAYSGLTISGRDSVVSDCYIHDTDYIGSNFASIFIRSGERIEILHNTLRRSGRIHIYMMAQAAFSECRIANNELSDYSCLTSDCGAIYTWSTDGGGTEICRNRVYCTTTDDGAANKAISGIYLDNYCSDFRVYRNLISGDRANTCYGLQLNLSSTDTLCVNNTVADCTYAFAVYGVPTDEADAATSVVSNNLFVHNGNDIHYYAAENGTPVFYQGKLKNGAVPVPISESARFGGSANCSLSSANALDENMVPAENARIIDAGTEIPGITDGFLGDAPDIGALERGGEVFSYGIRGAAAVNTP